MVFPHTPLDRRTELRLDGVWTDITSDVYERDAMEIDHGRRDFGSRTDPGNLTITLNNRDGKYSTRNPESPLWGLLGPNTAVRVSVPGDTSYLELTGAETSYASTPDHASLDITGDIELRWDGEANWYGPGAVMLLGKWGGVGERSYHMRLQDGWLYMQVQYSSTTFVFAAQPLPVLPDRAALRTVLDADNGGGGFSISHYWAPTIAGPWTQIGDTFSSTLVGPITVHTSTAPLTISPTHLNVSPPRRPYEGKVYAAQVYGAGVLVASPDFTTQAVGSAGFTDSAGRAWTYNGTARISNRAYRFHGEISTWPKAWVPGGADVWCSVEAAGVLRRYDQGTKALNSTLRRRIPSGNPIAYWHFEEDREASRASSPITGVQPAAVTGIEWAAVDTLPSSKALPKLSSAATLSAIVPTATDGQWQVECVYNADDNAPPDAGPRAEILSISTTGTVRRWVISMKAGSAHVAGYNASGTDIINQGISFTRDHFHGWHRLRFYVQDVGGGQMEWVVGWAHVNENTLQFDETVTGSPGHVTAVTANWGALTENWSFGHLSVMPDAANTIYNGSDSAYSGETAWQRLSRLATEESLPIARVPGRLTPERVGPQRPEEILELLHQAAEADGGILIEDRDRLGLVYRERSSMYAQEPALILDCNEPGLDDENLKPKEEADFVRNDITVKRSGGSEGRAVLVGGKYGTDRIGSYDHAPELSLDADTQTEPIAYWLLHLLTHDGARYPSVTVMLHKPGAQALIPDILRMREGDLIRIINLPSYVEFGHLDLIVQGWHERAELQQWTITFNCSPAGPWRLATTNVVAEGFEDGVYDVTITGGGNLPWTRTTAQAHSGSNSLRSGAISNNQTSDAALTLPAAATSLSFWYRTSSEASGPGFEGDRLLVLVDGVQVLRAQGATAWTKFTVDVTGKSAVVFRYAKDNSATSGEDAVYIDDLRIIVGSHAPTKANTDGSELAAGVDADDGTLSVNVTAGPRWTTDTNEMPILIDVDGEQMLVTAISGTSNPQTFTIGARSYNGVTKAHLAGAPVTLAYPAIASL
ncbi:hypothetical protein RM704_15500 [Streptomyces sp. DSM 3412]|uniref:Minor tail protein n=1 Tax=Streptomyces gottesmaniae TaxID=3075518 RepID=A0ABU2YX03_9ACTN|nr:hypothetical protein [Streptomyces sp. DSM 3412]MDT0568857.1 hypothetical protein [Streptomyces sp. DSM 3412]